MQPNKDKYFGVIIIVMKHDSEKLDFGLSLEYNLLIQ